MADGPQRVQETVQDHVQTHTRGGYDPHAGQHCHVLCRCIPPPHHPLHPLRHRKSCPIGIYWTRTVAEYLADWPAVLLVVQSQLHSLRKDGQCQHNRSVAIADPHTVSEELVRLLGQIRRVDMIDKSCSADGRWSGTDRHRRQEYALTIVQHEGTT